MASKLSINIEIASTAQLNALIEAVELYCDMNGERANDNARRANKPGEKAFDADWTMEDQDKLDALRALRKEIA